MWIFMEYNYLKKWATILCIYSNIKNEEQQQQLAHGLWGLDVNFMRIHVMFSHIYIIINNRNGSHDRFSFMWEPKVGFHTGFHM
jgi:hypothetical protein